MKIEIWKWKKKGLKLQQDVIVNVFN